MRVLGIVFAGTATEHREAMSSFVAGVLGLERIEVGGTTRSLGFLVDDLAAAVDALREAGVEPGPVAENARFRYSHFRAPDGSLYELVERR